jgi:hypothetical protein
VEAALAMVLEQPQPPEGLVHIELQVFVCLHQRLVSAISLTFFLSTLFEFENSV